MLAVGLDFDVMDYRHGNHTKFKIDYHFVWVTKYRYHMLEGDIALRVRELVRQTCEYFEIQILRGVVSKDHVHSVPRSGGVDERLI